MWLGKLSKLRDSVIVEPQYNEPLYNQVLTITSDFLYPRNDKIHEKEPWYNETSS